MNWSLCRVWLTKDGETLAERHYKLGPTKNDLEAMNYNIWKWANQQSPNEPIQWSCLVVEQNVQPPEPYMYILLPGDKYEIPMRDCWVS